MLSATIRTLRRCTASSLLAACALALVNPFVPAHAAPFAYLPGLNEMLVVDLATNAVTKAPLPSVDPLSNNWLGVDMAFTRDGARGYVNMDHSVFCDAATNFCGRAAAHSFNPANNSFGPPVRLRLSQSGPGYIAMSPDGRFVYPAEQSSRYQVWSIYAVDTATNALAGEPIRVPARNGGAFVVTPDGKTIVIGGNNIVTADLATRRVVGTPIAAPAAVIALSADGRQVYALSQFSAERHRVYAIDLATRSLVREFIVPFSLDLARSPDGSLLAVANPTDVTIIDLASGTVSEPIALMSDGDTAFFSNPGRGLSFTPDGSRLYLVATLRWSSPQPVPALLGVEVRTRTALPPINLPAGANSVFIPGPGTLPPPALTFPRTPVLDRFVGGQLTPLAPNWTGAITGYRFNSGVGGSLLDVQLGGRVYWQPRSFGVNQEAFVTLRKIDPDSQAQGLTLKAQGANPDAAPDISHGAIEVRYNVVTGAVYLITYLPRAAAGVIYTPIAMRFADGDQLGARVRANGVVEVYRNGTRIGTRTLNSADQAFFNHNGGRIGLRYNTTAFDAEVDDFGGGNAP